MSDITITTTTTIITTIGNAITTTNTTTTTTPTFTTTHTTTTITTNCSRAGRFSCWCYRPGRWGQCCRRGWWRCLRRTATGTAGSWRPRTLSHASHPDTPHYYPCGTALPRLYRRRMKGKVKREGGYWKRSNGSVIQVLYSCLGEETLKDGRWYYGRKKSKSRLNEEEEKEEDQKEEMQLKWMTLIFSENFLRPLFSLDHSLTHLLTPTLILTIQHSLNIDSPNFTFMQYFHLHLPNTALHHPFLSQALSLYSSPPDSFSNTFLAPPFSTSFPHNSHAHTLIYSHLEPVIFEVADTAFITASAPAPVP